MQQPVGLFSRGYYGNNNNNNNIYLALLRFQLYKPVRTSGLFGGPCNYCGLISHWRQIYRVLRDNYPMNGEEETWDILSIYQSYWFEILQTIIKSFKGWGQDIIFLLLALTSLVFNASCVYKSL